eukprot:764708-Prymnesium_polylepis.1
MEGAEGVAKRDDGGAHLQELLVVQIGLLQRRQRRRARDRRREHARNVSERLRHRLSNAATKPACRKVAKFTGVRSLSWSRRSDDSRPASVSCVPCTSGSRIGKSAAASLPSRPATAPSRAACSWSSVCLSSLVTCVAQRGRPAMTRGRCVCEAPARIPQRLPGGSRHSMRASGGGAP